MYGNREALVRERCYGLRQMRDVLDECLQIDEIEILGALRRAAKTETATTGVLEIIEDHGVIARVVQWGTGDCHGDQA